MLDGLIPPLIVSAVTLALVAIRWWTRRRSSGADAARIACVVVLAALLELAMGRTPVYRHGPIRLWSGDINSEQNSQQIADPYTFSHVIHGAAFYGLTRVALGGEPLMLRVLVSVGLEAAWEVYENTDQVINRYRTETIANGYFGDSVLNSMSDILACVIGFVLAWRLPTRVTVAGVVATELALAWLIRDNLTLNIIMLVHPIDAIRHWQMGA